MDYNIANQSGGAKGPSGAVQYTDGGGGFLGSSDVTIKNSNVGIGNTTLIGKFNVDTTATTVLGNGYSIRLSGPATAASDQLQQIGVGGISSSSSSPIIFGSRTALTTNFSTASFFIATRTVDTDTAPTLYRFYIIPSGNIGIGTTSPVFLLHLSKTPPTSFGSPYVQIGRGDGVDYTNDRFTIGFGYTIGGSVPPVEIGCQTKSGTGNTKADIVFAARDTTIATDVAVERMRITSAGNVGIGTTTPNANAILDASSTTKAFMPPRMTTAQKTAISSLTAGMVVYDSTLNKLCVYTTAWETITSI